MMKKKDKEKDKEKEFYKMDKKMEKQHLPLANFSAQARTKLMDILQIRLSLLSKSKTSSTTIKWTTSLSKGW